MLKTERLTIKVLPVDKAALEQIAQAEGEPVAVVVRRLIREAVHRHDLLQTPPATMPGQEERMNNAEVSNV